jgi:outer membrane lipoprotein-sorting protein/peroxiredoxin
MSLFLRPLGCAFICLSLLSRPSAVQAQTAAHIDPHARALLQSTVAAQTTLTSFAATLTMHGSNGGSEMNQTLTLSYRKPQSARITVTGSSGPLAQFVSDGKTLTVYNVRLKLYKQDRLRPDAPIIPFVFSQADGLLPRLLARPDSITRFLTEPGASARMGTPAQVSGVPTDTVLLTLPLANGPTTVLTFSLGRGDHLLRRLSQTQTDFSVGSMQTSSQTETLTHLTSNPALLAAAFVFSPPPGTHKYTEYDARLVPGAHPFSFTAKDLNGHPISLAQYRGKVVLLDFWATWCPPCVGEMPDIIASYRKYHARGFDIVGLSLDESQSALAGFIQRNHMPWRQVFGGRKFESLIPRQYGVIAIPFSLLIGRDGKISAVAEHGAELTAAIARAVAKK